jgi:hypothetical protein
MDVLWIVVCAFVLFLLAIVLSVLLRYTDYDYPFSIFKLFLSIIFSFSHANISLHQLTHLSAILLLTRFCVCKFLLFRNIAKILLGSDKLLTLGERLGSSPVLFCFGLRCLSF